MLIAGAGPTGLMTACHLARHGVKVMIIDRKSRPSAYSGALFMQARTLEIFDQMGLAHEFLEKGQVPDYLTVLHKGRQVFKADVSDMGRGLSKYPFVLMLKQEETENLLINFLEQHHVSVQWNTGLTGLRQKEEMVESDIRKTDQGVSVLTSRFLIGADGSNSTVRRLLQIPVEETPVTTPLFIFDGEASFKFRKKGRSITLERNSLYFVFHGDHISGLFPLPGNQWRIDGIVPRVLTKKKHYDYDDVKNEFAQSSALAVELGEKNWFSTFIPSTKLVKDFRKGRCFLAGDAAHVHTPIGAQGMNTGIQDAYNLAWKLAFTLKYDLSDRLLRTYGEERLPVARKLIKVTDRLFFQLIKNNRLNRILRNVVFIGFLRLLQPVAHWRIVQRAFFRSVSETEINYASQGGCKREHSPGLKEGKRLPYISFTDKQGRRKDLHDQVSGKTYVLFFFKEEIDYKEGLSGFFTGLIKKGLVGTCYIPYNKNNREWLKRFNIKERTRILVRPDLYIEKRFF